MPTIECGISNQPDLLVARGPTLPVIIGLDDDLVIGASSLTDIAQQLSPALVDTGSDTTCVDSDLAHTLNLPIVNQEVVSMGVHGRGMVNFHLARISIPALGATFAGVFCGSSSGSWSSALFSHHGQGFPAPLPANLRRANRSRPFSALSASTLFIGAAPCGRRATYSRIRPINVKGRCCAPIAAKLMDGKGSVKLM